LTANSSSLAVEAPHEEIQKAEDCMKATATALGITRAEAMLRVLTGEFPCTQADTKLVLFSPKGMEDGPAYLQGFGRSEEHTSELQSRFDLVCRLLLEKKKTAHVD